MGRGPGVAGRSQTLAAAAALAVGAGVTWNIANVGAVADPLSDAYGVSLAVVGLFTTALFVTHLAVQVPGGRAIDRLGARRVAFAALGVIVVGNLVAVAAPHPVLAVAGRAVVGLGSGAGFVAGADFMRAARPSPFLQGLYGGATMAGAGLAIATVPQLEGVLGWRAPYWSAAAIAAVTALVLLPARLDVRPPTHRAAALGVVRDRRLVRLAVLHSATFGLSVVAANWVVPLLERHGLGRGPAGAVGAFVLLAGLLTRPLGGLLVTRPDRARGALAGALVAGSAALATLASGPSPPVLAAGAVVLGLAAGVPFAAIFSAAQRLRPDAPAAAVGLVNAWAIAAIVVGTPLLGLTFSLPGEGRVGFAVAAALWAAALAALGRRGRFPPSA